MNSSISFLRRKKHLLSIKRNISHQSIKINQSHFCFLTRYEKDNISFNSPILLFTLLLLTFWARPQKCDSSDFRTSPSKLHTWLCYERESLTSHVRICGTLVRLYIIYKSAGAVLTITIKYLYMPRLDGDDNMYMMASGMIYATFFCSSIVF